MATRDEALAALLSLDPAPVFGESYRNKHLPGNLEIYFGPPEEFFLAGDTQSRYTDGGLIPILDDGNFGIVTFFDPESRTLVQKDVESPLDEYARFHNWQQYLGALVINIAESIDDDERLRVMSDLVGYRYFDETLGVLDGLKNAPYEEYHRARARFLASLRA
jgi:hypothetical protein